MDQPDAVRSHNREAWDAEVERGNRWTVPVDHDAIEAARQGRLEVGLTDSKAVPAAWFPDLVFHPVSNLFVPEVRPVWTEAFRVLRKGGILLAGFVNPAYYVFDLDLADSTGELRVEYQLPYVDPTSLSEERLRRKIEGGEPLEFGHTLEDQIGGQIAAGFVISGFYEDRHRDDPIASYMPTLIATRATKP
jgi:hypothetical protein